MDNKTQQVTQIIEAYKNGTSFQNSLENLIKTGLKQEDAHALVEEAKASYYRFKRKSGFTFLAIGCLLLAVGFMLTVFLFHKNTSIDIIMYSGTITGILCLFKGMVDYLGL